MNFPIALQLYTVRDELKADFEGTLKKVKALGYDGVEFAGLFGKSADEVKKMCEEIGLVPISAHVPFVDMMENPQLLETYAEIGCKYVVIPYLTEEYRPGEEKFAEVIEGAKLLGSKANELGMKLCYHNHDFEFTKINGEYALDILYNSVPADLLQTELDTCWVNVGGEVPAEYIEKYTGRAPVVHLKDFVMKGKGGRLYELIGIDDDSDTAEEDAFSFAPVGSGCQDMPAILDASIKAGAEWVVVEQDRPAKGHTPMQSAEMGREYLKTLGW